MASVIKQLLPQPSDEKGKFVVLVFLGLVHLFLRRSFSVNAVRIIAGKGRFRLGMPAFYGLGKPALSRGEIHAHKISRDQWFCKGELRRMVARFSRSEVFHPSGHHQLSHVSPHTSPGRPCAGA